MGTQQTDWERKGYVLVNGVLERIKDGTAANFRIDTTVIGQGVKNRRARVRPLHQEPDERVPLLGGVPGEEACWHEADQRFEIVFTVYSRRPCDWDGYDIKALQDFLIKAGIIPDDGWAALSGRVVSRKAETEAEEKTVIEITAVNKTPGPTQDRG